MHPVIISLHLQESEKANGAKTNLGFSEASATAEKLVQVANTDETWF